MTANALVRKVAAGTVVWTFVELKKRYFFENDKGIMVFFLSFFLNHDERKLRYFCSCTSEHLVLSFSSSQL